MPQIALNITRSFHLKVTGSTTVSKVFAFITKVGISPVTVGKTACRSKQTTSSKLSTVCLSSPHSDLFAFIDPYGYMSFGYGICH